MPEEVREEVRRRIEILGAGGGYVLAPCNVLQTDVPTGNILAMSDAGFEARTYVPAPPVGESEGP